MHCITALKWHVLPKLINPLSFVSSGSSRSRDGGTVATCTAQKFKFAFKDPKPQPHRQYVGMRMAQDFKQEVYSHKTGKMKYRTKKARETTNHVGSTVLCRCRCCHRSALGSYPNNMSTTTSPTTSGSTSAATTTAAISQCERGRCYGPRAVATAATQRPCSGIATCAHSAHSRGCALTQAVSICKVCAIKCDAQRTEDVSMDKPSKTFTHQQEAQKRARTRKGRKTDRKRHVWIVWR